jgi:hypothetical protein
MWLTICWHTLTAAAGAGGMRHNDPSYSFGVRQAIWQRVTPLNDTRVTYVEGGVPDYAAQMRRHKYCLAPAGHGWGIRLSQYMLNGCVPVIIQVRVVWSGGGHAAGKAPHGAAGQCMQTEFLVSCNPT